MTASEGPRLSGSWPKGTRNRRVSELGLRLLAPSRVGGRHPADPAASLFEQATDAAGLLAAVAPDACSPLHTASRCADQRSSTTLDTDRPCDGMLLGLACHGLRWRPALQTRERLGSCRGSRSMGMTFRLPSGGDSRRACPARDRGETHRVSRTSQRRGQATTQKVPAGALPGHRLVLRGQDLRVGGTVPATRRHDEASNDELRATAWQRTSLLPGV